MPTPAPRPSADDVVAVLRVHADRVHDAVRRQGATEQAAVDVVRAAAYEVVDRAATGVSDTDELVGWWFARARALGLDSTPDGGDLPTGSGLLADDREQELLAEGLELRPERERTALLLRDAYDLPIDVVGAGLGLDAEAAQALVGQARMNLLPDVYDTTVPSLAGHAVDGAALSRLAEGGAVPARDSATRRHAQACGLCRPAVEAQDDARRLLAGLAVVALTDADREQLLEELSRRTAALLPSRSEVAHAEALALADEEEELPRRLLAPLPVAAALVLAVGLGLGLGALVSRDGPREAGATRALAPVTAPPPLSLAPLAPTTPPPSAQPTTRVFTIAPTTPPTTAPPTSSAPPTATPPTATAAVVLEPSSGPNGSSVTVTGSGWTGGMTVTLTYLGTDNAETGSTATVTPEDDGSFETAILLVDPTATPGTHTVVADDGAQQASAPFEAT